jgi:hypothetical protein
MDKKRRFYDNRLFLYLKFVCFPEIIISDGAYSLFPANCFNLMNNSRH